MVQDPLAFFNSQIPKHQQEFNRLDQKYQLISWLRVIVFIGFAAVVGYLFYFREFTWSALSVALGIFLFGAIVNRHKKLGFQRNIEEILVKVNKDEIRRLNHELEEIENGEHFKDEKHPYSGDMDVFGKNSLFQQLNRSSSPTGQLKLSEWLRNLTGKEGIERRQEAIAELKPLVEWRQRIEALSRYGKRPDSFEKMELMNNWLSEKPIISKPHIKLIIAIAVGVFNGVFSLIVIVNQLPLSFLLIPALIGLGLVGGIQNSMIKVTDVAKNGLSLLENQLLLIKQYKRVSLKSQFFRNCDSALLEGSPAEEQINDLARLLNHLNNRGNFIYWIFNTIFLLDIYLIISIEKWKKRNADHLPNWIDAISDIEAINSLAGFAFAHPAYVLPEISQGLSLRATDLGHPLIKHENRVSNDFEIGNAKIGVVTGSNMSGKSTFLRTVGVNLVLAQIGAVVCAKSFSFSPILVYSSMRTSDNLEESVSSFYAELQRIEGLLRLLKEGRKVFFLLDEILKGTNTHDRQLGAKSLILQLIEHNCVGLVSTHDIALGELAQKHQEIRNLHFSSEIKNDKLFFDYTLKPGICQSFNASELMEQIGIKLVG
ncbi:MAG: hypothetical protein RJQ09_03180 [Cyclobacteriaceae bacterium]